MKSNLIKRVVAVILCLMMGLSLMSVGFTVSAYHYDDDTIHSYEDLNCAEDDCDCLEPDENIFKVVSPVSGTSVNINCSDVVFTGAYHEVQDYYKAQGQTDGMPVIPPTTLKVEKFMRYIPEGDTDVVATVSSTGRVITAYQVAVNAVMSGCSAEYLPICIAFTKAFNNPAYVSSLKDGSLTPMAFVNGPLARQLGIDNTQGMTIEEANIALGRFIEFALINLAGIASERSTSFGYMQPLVFSENDAACLDIGWDPYNVQQGFGLNESTVTATSFSMWGNNVTPATDLPEQIMKVIAFDITEKNLGGLGAADPEDYADTKRVVFITPQVANALATLYKDKENLEDALIETARRPMWMRAYAYYYANTGANLTGKSLTEVYADLMATSTEDGKVTASPDWLNGISNPSIETGATMKKGNTIFLVTGDDSRNKTQVMPGGVSVTTKAEVSHMYESLVTSMNYQPIENYYLSASDFTVIPPENITSVLTNGTYRILDSSTGSTYLTREGRVYFDSATNTLNYWAIGATAKASVVLDRVADANFIAYLENLGVNGSFRVYNGKFRDVTIRFSSNESKPDTNTVVLTAESVEGLTLTLHANNTQNSLVAGGIASDGSTVTMSSSITSFTANMDGDISMGNTNQSGFVTLDGTTVTVNTNAPAGSKAIIGTANSDGTYRTMTFEMKADGTYKITYNTANTLSLENSTIYLKGTFNSWESKDALKKTNTENIYTLTKAFEAGTYTFKIDSNGAWYGNKGTFTDSAMRWEMSTDVSDNCTFKATGGTYTFTWYNDAKRLTVSKDSEELPEIPEITTKTVYVGVVEHIKDFVPTLHYWNDSVGLAGDVSLTATGELVQYALGSAYWSNQKQNFKVYKTTIPADATHMKTWDSSSNSKWAAEEVAYAEDQILLLFEYSNVYHNVAAVYAPVVPCDHTNVETLAAVEATCEGTGLTEGKKCAGCGEVITAQTATPATGHTEVVIPETEATCKSTGLTEGKYCSICGKTITAQKIIPAKNHAWTNGECLNCNKICEHTYVDDKCTICGNIKDTASKLEGASISLGGNIAVNFHMTLSDNIIEDDNAKVVFTLPNNTKQTLYVKDAEVTEAGYYIFTCEVNAIQMSNTIKAQVLATGYESDVLSYSVVEYAEYLLKEASEGNTLYTDAVPLVKAMLNYGAYSQVYFEYETENLANNILSDEEKSLNEVNLTPYKPVTAGKEEGVRHHGSSLTLDSETVINIYFIVEDEENIPEFYVNGVATKPVKVNNFYRIRVEDIPAQNLDNEYVVTVGGLTVKYSALSYGYSAMYTNNDSLKNVAKALYTYNRAAETFLNTQNI